jgi:hypothetical protein
MDSGLLIASKYFIVVVDSIVYAYNCSLDAFAAKGAVYAKTRRRRVAFSAFSRRICRLLTEM